jgi:flagellar biosynthesis protein FlhB
VSATAATAAHAATGATAATAVHAATGATAAHAATAATGASTSPLDVVGRVPRAVLELALPLLAAIALAALVAHVAQTRAVWFPRRRLPGAPSMPRRSRIGFELTAAATIGVTCLGWLWMTAPRLAHLVDVPSAAPLAVVTFVVTLAIAWVALGALDAVLRRRELDEALAMTREEKREDDRLSAADPRWAAHRRALARDTGTDLGAAVARSAVVLVGEGTAVAIEWDATRQPVPLRAATGRGPRATQLVALARRHRVRVHLDESLARALADGDGPVPQAHWARLAEIVAAVRLATA